jgi:DtxR family transcriptional regulator, Mn-dependent transcriptional regulator
MPSSTVENYLKQILVESLHEDSYEVSMGKIADCLEVTPGTATTMVKSMESKGWVKYRPRKGVKLTTAGRKVGMSMLRRHRLLETFLVETLGLDWGEIHEEAEVLEHAISEKVLEKLDEFLGRPSHDPHGDPIPTRRGGLPKASNRNLLDCKVGDLVCIESIQDQEKEFLQFARKNRLIPGRKIEVTRHDQIADSIEIKIDKKTVITLGSKTAEKIVIRN